MSEQRYFYGIAILIILSTALGLSYFALHHSESKDAAKNYNEEVAKNLRVSIEVFKAKAKSLGSYKQLPLPYMGEDHALMVTGEGVPIGYHMEDMDYYFKDEAEDGGTRACAYFFQAALYAYRIPILLSGSTPPNPFNGYVAEGSKNNGFGGCRFIQSYASFGANRQYEIYYSTTDGSVYTHAQNE